MNLGCSQRRWLGLFIAVWKRRNCFRFLHRNARLLPEPRLIHWPGLFIAKGDCCHCTTLRATAPNVCRLLLDPRQSILGRIRLGLSARPRVRVNVSS